MEKKIQVLGKENNKELLNGNAKQQLEELFGLWRLFGWVGIGPSLSPNPSFYFKKEKLYKKPIIYNAFRIRSYIFLFYFQLKSKIKKKKKI